MLVVLLIISCLIVQSSAMDSLGQLMMPAFVWNDSCGWSCSAIDSLGPPPDAILTMPPPPLPPFFQQLLTEEEFKSNYDSNKCNFCNIFNDTSAFSSEIMTTKSTDKANEPWLSAVVATVLGSCVFGAFLLLLLIKCKKWKIFPNDSCPILPESFLGGHKSAPPPCSPTECISPVVNEKSPQSIITDSPTKKTSIPSKYWKRGSNIILNNPDGRRSVEPNIDLDPYNDTASCTSSPVYAELDAAGVNVNHVNALTNQASILIGGPSISPYAVCNTYSEVADAVRMAQLGSASALLPDASYDNAAYLPTSNSDHYNSRSLRRAHRAATLAQLGSTTPLLSSHYHLTNGSPQLYLTGYRPHKKPRPLHSQIPRNNLIRMQEELQQTRFDRQTVIGTGRRAHGIYTDSPAMSTFRVPFKENNRRPLPPVPGVRL